MESPLTEKMEFDIKEVLKEKLVDYHKSLGDTIVLDAQKPHNQEYYYPIILLQSL